MAAAPSAAGADPRPEPIRLLAASVAPNTLFFDGGSARIRFRLGAQHARRQAADAAGPGSRYAGRPGRVGGQWVVVKIRKRRGGRIVRSFRGRRSAGRLHVQRWAGLTGRGRVAEDGRYRVEIGSPGGPFRRVGGLRLLGHLFPVRGPHGTRGPIGEFGAPRSGGRSHEGFDITAPCGTPLRAARGGRVLKAAFDPVLYGWFVLIDGRWERRNHFYSHLRSRPPVRAGQRIRTRSFIGEVGRTGNARTTPCHLHYELRSGGVPMDPEPALARWDRAS